jgi:hypothetical protein
MSYLVRYSKRLAILNQHVALCDIPYLYVLPVLSIDYAIDGPIEVQQSEQLPLMPRVPTTAKLIILLAACY